MDFEGRPASRWQPALDKMHAAIQHRGPDGWGRVVIDGADVRATSPKGERVSSRAGGRGPTVGFAHARLAIIDLSDGGHQPMAASGDAGWITYNGEIYNYRALREQWLAGGKDLRTQSDTEILTELLASDGVDALAGLRGMFAFAWWDDRAHRLLLARDRFGIKPLVYARPSPGVLLFASAPRALMASGLVGAELRADRVAEFYARGSVDAAASVWRDIEAVPPATAIDIHAAGAASHEYWSLEDHYLDGAAAADVPTIARAAHRAIVGSVEAHLVSDVPVAIFLSGGLDSTAVLAAAREVTTGPLQTLTVSMPGAALDESAEARAIARRFGAEHREVSLDTIDLDQMLDEFFAAMPSPSVDGFNTFLVARAARQAGVKVALSGVGGDELFGGYDSFVGVPRVASLAASLGPVRPVLAAGCRMWPSARVQKLGGILSAAPRTTAQTWWEYRRLFDGRDVAAIAGVEGPAAPSVSGESALPFAIIRLLETRHFLESQLLADADAFTMCGALELRTPLVDHVVSRDVVQAGAWLRRSGDSFKRTLFRALGTLTMPGAVDRPKQGFVLPFDQWLRTALTESSPTRLRDVASRLRQPRYAGYVDRFLRRRLHWSRIWALYTFDRLTTR